MSISSIALPVTEAHHEAVHLEMQRRNYPAEYVYPPGKVHPIPQPCGQCSNRHPLPLYMIRNMSCKDTRLFNMCKSCVEHPGSGRKLSEYAWARQSVQEDAVNCAHVSCRGCGEAVLRNDLLLHWQDTCAFELMQCDNVGCTEQVLRNQLSNHKQNSCSYRMIECIECKEQMTFQNLSEHQLNFCINGLTTCTQAACQQQYIRNQQDKHQESCQGAMIVCTKVPCVKQYVRKHEQEHCKTCVGATIVCSQGCNLRRPRHEILIHEKYSCEFRLLPCKYAPQCPFTGAEQTLFDHESTCEYAPMVCSQCKQSGFIKATLANHVNRTCPLTMITCTNQDCTIKCKRNEVEKHCETECPWQLIPCTYCCSQSMKIKRMDLDVHLDACALASSSECEQCLQSLKQHRKAAHVCESIVICPACSQTFAEANAEKHFIGRCKFTTNFYSMMNAKIPGRERGQALMFQSFCTFMEHRRAKQLKSSTAEATPICSGINSSNRVYHDAVVQQAQIVRLSAELKAAQAESTKLGAEMKSLKRDAHRNTLKRKADDAYSFQTSSDSSRPSKKPTSTSAPSSATSKTIKEKHAPNLQTKTISLQSTVANSFKSNQQQTNRPATALPANPIQSVNSSTTKHAMQSSPPPPSSTANTHLPIHSTSVLSPNSIQVFKSSVSTTTTAHSASAAPLKSCLKTKTSYPPPVSATVSAVVVPIDTTMTAASLLTQIQSSG